MIMSCNEEHFNEEEQVLRDTYLSILPENIDYIIYKGGYDEDRYDNETHTLYLNVNDDLDHTYHKTYKAFSYVNSLFEYDYIFRTNTSTYININLLNAFVQTLLDTNTMWGGELMYDIGNNKCVTTIYLRGNGLLMSKDIVNTIILYGWGYAQIDSKLIDDGVLGCVFNNYHIIHYSDYMLYIKSFREGWYKAILNDYCYHQVCLMNNTDKDFNYLKTMMIIQIRNWYDRSQEIKHFKEIHEVFMNNTDEDIKMSIQMQYDYSKNPDVFIGAEYGFVTLDKIKNGEA